MKIMARKRSWKHFRCIFLRGSRVAADYDKLRFKFFRHPGERKENNKYVLEIHATADLTDRRQDTGRYEHIVITFSARDLQRLGPQMAWLFDRSNKMPGIWTRKPSTHHNTRTKL